MQGKMSRTPECAALLPQECMLRDAVLLKLLAKLLTICVIFADQTRLVMGKAPFISFHFGPDAQPTFSS